MLKISTPVVVKTKLKARGKCPIHPRFNPERGERDVKGGCKSCLALIDVTKARDDVMKARKELLDAIDRFEAVAAPYSGEVGSESRPGGLHCRPS